MGTTNGCLRKGGSVIPGDRLRLQAPWSAAGSVQHVCSEGSLLNTFHFNPPLKQQSLLFIVFNAKTDVIAPQKYAVETELFTLYYWKCTLCSKLLQKLKIISPN